MGTKNKLEFSIDAPINLVEAELLRFHDEEGGNSIPPFLECVRENDNSIKYELFEEKSQKF